MDDLIARITEKTGLDAETARKAVGIILAFLRKEGPETEVNALIAAMPAAEQAMADGEEASGAGGLMGSLGGMMGGGVMQLGGKLMQIGVEMNQMQPLGKELFAYGREKVGEDTLGPIVGSIPGLQQFV
ncbi:DUF2267 domain-containing protein [Salinarimonas sp.]|uniref:DUF2267 domain-containing protein n=1 Tax=Salinarimonas sp. TaxID=2766526 RepID=UPI0032D8EA48